MTIKEKAKAYDKALESIKELYLKGSRVVVSKEEFENIFPELKESEDERIRKVLVGFFKSYKEQGTCGAETFNGISTDNILAWLEKQGEKPIFEFKANNWYVSKVDGKIHDMTYIPNAVEQSKWSENDEDGKVNDETNGPTGYGKYVDECLNEASKHFFSDGEDKYGVADLFYAGVRCGKYWLEKQAPKPKWSDDDEQYLLVCKNALRKYQVSDKWDAEIISKWLEDKLKQGEPKPKWTEEDSLMIDSIINTMKWLEGKGTTNMKIDWLKSLKQRMGV